MKKFSANKASMDKLTSEGWTCEMVEKRIPNCFITKDAFGFADILACSPTRGIMLVQVTTGDHMADRVTKTKAEPRHAIWIASGGRIQVHGWATRVGKKERECRILEITKE